MSINRKRINNYTETIAYSLGSQIVKRREYLEITQDQLAQRALISVRWLRYIEEGKKLPSIYIIASISMVLDFYEWEFFSLTKF